MLVSKLDNDLMIFSPNLFHIYFSYLNVKCHLFYLLKNVYTGIQLWILSEGVLHVNECEKNIYRSQFDAEFNNQSESISIQEK